jgi:plastocyanin
VPVTVSVTPTQLAVEPGRSGSLTVDVRGDAQDVRLELTGTAAAWAVVAPPAVSVPGRARVVVQVPRSPGVAPGPASITVRAGDAEATATVDVLPFSDLRVSLSPRVSRGRSGGRHVLHVENLGNQAVTAAVETGGDETVRVEVDGVTLPLAPGEAAAVPVRVKATRPRLAGRPQSRPFAVKLRGGSAQPATTAEGLFVQDRVRWPLPVAVVLVLGAVAVAMVGGGGSRDRPVAVPTTLAGAVPAQTAQCPPDQPGPAGTLLVQNFLFCPIRVTVAAGSELRWSNRDTAPHTVSADGDEFDTGTFGRGEERTVRFERAGTFHYFCRLHPFMRGTVVVA